MTYETKDGDFDIVKLLKHIGIVIIVLVILFGSFGTVKAGQVGIKVRFGAVTGKVLTPGLYLKIPFVEHVVKMDMQTQKEQATAGAASKDLQTVTTVLALNYAPNKDSIVGIYANLGIDYKTRVIDPAIQESVKAVTAKYTAEEVITKRDQVGQDIDAHLREKLQSYGILVQQVSVVDFNFSKSFNDAIEAKVTAEQNALAAKNKLAQVQYEAQQAVEEANGKAKALQIEGQALSQNPQVKELRAIEKWNGILPQVTSGTVPFINIK